MTTTVAKTAFVNLAVSAKLHRLLDLAAAPQRARSEGEALAFDAHLAQTLRTLETRKDSPLRKEARQMELELIKRDFVIVEKLFHAYVAHGDLPETVTQRFDRVFAEIKEKIRLKEKTF